MRNADIVIFPLSVHERPKMQCEPSLKLHDLYAHIKQHSLYTRVAQKIEDEPAQ